MTCHHRALPDRTEIAVVGAGPAGSTVAAALAQRGRDVTLFERDTFPRDKVCGEFLSPESLDCLNRLGVLEKFLELDPPPMTRARLTVPDGTQTELRLPDTARGLSRKRLDALLFEHAAGCGANCFDGADVRQIQAGPTDLRWLTVRHNETTHRVEADVVVAAHGRRSRLDRQLERPFFEHRSPYVAFKRHHRLKEDTGLPVLEGVVELHAFDGGYCGISYAEDGLVNVCTMLERRIVQRDDFDGHHFWQSLSRRDTPLARRLRALRPCPGSKTCAVAQIPLSTKRLHTDGTVLYVGDAAGMIAPLAGDGQAMALESGLQLAELLDDHLPNVPAHRWSWMWRSRYEPRIRLGQLLQHTMIRPAVSAPALRLVETIPAIGRFLIGQTRTR